MSPTCKHVNIRKDVQIGNTIFSKFLFYLNAKSVTKIFSVPFIGLSCIRVGFFLGHNKRDSLQLVVEFAIVERVVQYDSNNAWITSNEIMIQQLDHNLEVRVN